MFLSYSHTRNNWGDIISPFIFKWLTGRDATLVGYRGKDYDKEKLMMAGSCLQRAGKNTIVWGAGYIASTAKVGASPKKICAVRGPLTKERLITQKIRCPSIYGDPALVVPFMVKVQRVVKYRVGIIPHYVDYTNAWVKKKGENANITVINIKEGFTQVIKKVCECGTILSSSLHGLILADAYRIPSLWIELSNKLVGDGFKFRDYYRSIESNIEHPVSIAKNTKIKNILPAATEKNPYKHINVKNLVDAFPYPVKEDVYSEIEKDNNNVCEEK